MKLLRMHKKKIIFGVLIIGCILVFLFFLLNNNEAEEGVQYLQNQEALKVSDIEDEMKQLRSEDRKKAVESGQVDVFALFDDYVIFGDSRVYGFGTYGFMPSGRVFAGGGDTILNVDDWLSTLKSLSPSNVYLSYGVNDMGLNLDETEAGSYGDLYEQQVNKILEICPDSHIYVNSIIPATPAAVEESPNWSNVDGYNAQLKKICEKNGWTYVDNTALVEGKSTDSIYQSDGIHFLNSFYTPWAQNMIDASEE